MEAVELQETNLNEGGQMPAASSSNGNVTITWENLSYTVTSKKGEEKQLLSNLNGIVKPAEMMAIMGPSGAGKTTFMDAVSGRLNNSSGFSGKLLINGKILDRSFKRKSAYVMQDDALVGSMTVRENITYSARLRLPSTISNSDRTEAVNQIIRDLGLDRVADSRVGTVLFRGVSGGERRRVAIASELITRPKLIYLDEPTSGLDSTASYFVISHILELAKRSECTVLVTIHQPSSVVFDLFTKLLLLTSGKCAYFGDRIGAPEFFASVGHALPQYTNPSDFYLDVLNLDFMEDKSAGIKAINAIVAGYEASATAEEYKKQIKSLDCSGNQITVTVSNGDAVPFPDKYRYDGEAQEGKYANSFARQTATLVERSVLNSIRDPIAYWIRVAMYCMLAILMGTVWLDMGTSQNALQDRLAGHFFAVAFLCFMAVAATPAFLENRLIFERERASGAYSVGAYVVSTVIMTIPFVFIVAFSFSAIAYPLMGLHSGAGHFFRYVMYLYAALIVAECMVLFWSAAVPFFVGALTMAAFSNGFFMVVQGYFVRKTNIPSFWLYIGHYWDYQKYSFEAIVVNDLQGLTFQCDRISETECFCNYPSALNAQCEFAGEDIIRLLDYEDVNQAGWVGIMFLIAFVFIFGFYTVLRYRKVRR